LHLGCAGGSGTLWSDHRGTTREIILFSRGFRFCSAEFPNKWATGFTTLMSALALNHSSGSLRQDLQVQPYGPGTRILQIQANHFVKAGPAASFHLPQSGDAGLDFENAPPVPDFILSKFVGQRRPRSNKRHISTQDIPELRQLVQTGLADKAADGSHAWIFLNLEDRLRSSFGLSINLSGDELFDILLVDFWVTIRSHRAEFQYCKSLPVLAETFLLEQHRALGRKLDRRATAAKTGERNIRAAVLPARSIARLIASGTLLASSRF